MREALRRKTPRKERELRVKINSDMPALPHVCAFVALLLHKSS